MRKIKIYLVAAARPNFMKIAPLYHALKIEKWALPLIVHTGQHYDINMSSSFFKDLALPNPYKNLEVGSGTHAEQTGMVMIAFEKLVMSERPDLIVVVGDVNSTMACTIGAVKLGVEVAHLEAGLRSFDRTMPEEINRIVTDSLADILWTPSPDADQNLLKEGISPSKIKRVGNIMIDSLELSRDKIERENGLASYQIKPREYAVTTIHRPSNVDNKEQLEKLCNTLIDISERIKLVLPLHPRTRTRLTEFGLQRIFKHNDRIIITEPLSYFKFMNLVFNARLVITDSGGIQEETTYLGIPCLTLRDNTERPVTIELGTNSLSNVSRVASDVNEILQGKYKKGSVPELWDGKTAKRITEEIMTHYD
jgi:UDP-N-acetylglucosamine 2-epimerase (non-hydrolysing)